MSSLSRVVGMEPEDAALVERSRDEDLSAFNQIVERYQSRILGDRTAAQDVAQDAFISAYKALAGFRGGSLRAWLMRITANRSKDYIRASRRRHEQSLDQSMLNPSFSLRSRGPSPEQMAIGREFQAEIQRGILTLPEDQRTTLVLVDVQGMSYAEAAEAIGASLGTVKSRLNRARSGIRDFMLERRELLPDQFRQVR